MSLDGIMRNYLYIYTISLFYTKCLLIFPTINLNVNVNKGFAWIPAWLMCVD